MRIQNKEVNWQVTNVFSRNMDAVYQKTETNAIRYKYIINTGSSRSSKSHSIMQILFILALQKRYNIVIVMKILAQIKDTIIKTILSQLLIELPKEFNIQYNKSEQIIYFNNGSKISFNGADDEGRVKGLESDILWVDETNEMSTDVLKQLFTRNKYFCFMSYNPSGDLTFIQNYIDRTDSIEIHSTWRDNPFVTDEQIRTLLEYKKSDYNFWLIYSEGKRGVPKEAVYTHFQEQNTKPENVYDNYIYGLDFSISRTPLMRIWYSSMHNKVYIEEVFFASDVGASDIVDLFQNYDIDLQTPIIADSASPMIIKDIRKHGYNIIATNKKRFTVLDGVNFIKSLQVYYRTSDRIETELSNYKFRKIGNIITDQLIPKYDDEMDAIRYAIMYLNQHRLINQPQKDHSVKKYYKF